MKVLLFVMFSRLFVFSAFADESFGEVKFLKGKAWSGVSPVKVGAKVFPGDVITTGPKSFVRIVLREEAAIQIGPNSSLQVTRREETTHLSLLKGFVLSTVKALKSRKKSRFEVTTKNASLGVRGTTFFVKEESDGRTFHCVCEGTVAVHWNGGRKNVTTKHHGSPKWISSDGKSVLSAPMGRDHTDEEIEKLKQLL